VIAHTLMSHSMALVWAWDPFLKGVVFVLVAGVLLAGSVYLVLSTDLGSRVGFLVAAAALCGWIFVMAIVWTVYGIGLKGRPAAWKASLAPIAGEVGKSPTTVLADFPEKWHKIDPASPQAADAQAAADVELTKTVFKSTSEYKTFEVWEKGGEKHFLTLLHKPHYLVLEVQPVTKVPTGSTAKPQPDTSKPVVSVVMVRDLGSLRLPAFVISVSFGLLFAVLCLALHLRDKALIALRSAPVAAPSG
jgi:hypothetical protein